MANSCEAPLAYYSAFLLSSVRTAHSVAAQPDVGSAKAGRGGRTCTSVAQKGGAFTVRCVCCFATPRNTKEGC